MIPISIFIKKLLGWLLKILHKQFSHHYMVKCVDLVTTYVRPKDHILILLSTLMCPSLIYVTPIFTIPLILIVNKSWRKFFINNKVSGYLSDYVIQSIRIDSWVVKVDSSYQPIKYIAFLFLKVHLQTNVQYNVTT